MNRVERLGGDADSTIGAVTIADDIESAYRNTAALLTEIRDAIQQAIGAAKAGDDETAHDHVTQKLLMHLQAQVDHKLAKVEAWLRQVEDLQTNYAITVI